MELRLEIQKEILIFSKINKNKIIVVEFFINLIFIFQTLIFLELMIFSINKKLNKLVRASIKWGP